MYTKIIKSSLHICLTMLFESKYNAIYWTSAVLITSKYLTRWYEYIETRPYKTIRIFQWYSVCTATHQTNPSCVTSWHSSSLPAACEKHSLYTS
jgi:hypothetical protein